MNYFSHGWRYIDDPYFLAGVCVPDWLGVLNRKMRVRSRHAEPFIAHADARVASLARGVMQHHKDDDWFHGTRAFAETSLALSVLFRQALAEGDGHRRGFLGHILVEMLLDAELIARSPDRLRAYYAALASLDGRVVEVAVNQLATVTSDRLALLVPRFVAEGFLWDYADDDKLIYRLNQVLSRVKLPSLPADFRQTLPAARQMVRDRHDELLSPD
jgi:hypothetical protein